MAITILFGSLGLTLDMHFCQGQLKSINLLGAAKSCHQLDQTNHCSSNKKSGNCCSNTNKITLLPAPSESCAESCQKNCCNNESILLAFDIDLVQSQVTNNISTKSPQIATLNHSDLTLHFTFNKSPNFYQNYKPPLLNQDIIIHVQSFLL